MESRKPIAAQIGNVSIHPISICPTTRGSVPFLLHSPTPIIAHVFAWVVAVGIPKKEQTPSMADDAVSAALLPSASRWVISQPTFFIIFEPPSIVPNVIAVAHIRVT